MSTYQYAQGFNQSGSLQDAHVQPQSPGILYNTKFGIGGSIYEESPYVIWEYGFLELTDLNQILTDLGLSSVPTAEVTIKTTDEYRNFVTKNAVVFKPYTKQTSDYLLPGQLPIEVQFYFWIM
jgi:hypothetical protein